MIKNFKFQTLNFKLMYRSAIFFTLIILFGAGCVKNDFSPLTSDKVRQMLYVVANDLDWMGDIIEKPASEENYYGISYVLFGPFKQGEQINDEVLIDEMEVIEFENPAYAQKSYSEEECFKGRGMPIQVYGMDACCLNDRVKGWSSAVMVRDNYIFRTKDYFHADCGAAEYLKVFWKNYDK